MTRSESGLLRRFRRIMHKKQERLQIQSGVPTAQELIEGVPVLRIGADGELAEYINFQGILYKSVFTRV